ncbi:MAG: RNA polymerase sigma factor [Chloroflexia bacterium]|nr:RNA polymerase sigma factor [Chloroflexia bacterium]
MRSVRGASVEGRPLDDEETELVGRAVGGDIAAYEEIVRRYQDVAFRLAFVITGSAPDAEEAAQDGFVRAYRALGRFRPGSPLRPWLLTIVANTARNRRAAASRHVALPLAAAEDRVAEDPARSPEAMVLADEARRELLAGFAALRDDDRMVIACRYFLDLSESETAAVFGCPRGTVKSRLSRALGRLRLELGGGGRAGFPAREVADG